MTQGLTYEQRKARRWKEGGNIIPAPHTIPQWLCCLRPCLEKKENMLLYREMVTEDAEVRS